MSPDALAVFGLSCEPFSKEIDDADLWLPPSKRALLDDLVDAAEARKNVALVGEPGVGKTCVLRALRHALPKERFRLTYCHNVTLGRRDFYRQLCLALGLPKSNNAGDVFWAINTHVEQLAQERLSPVFLVDEAHLLHQDTLDHLHILLNYAWDSRALLSLILVGLPDLEERLRLRCVFRSTWARVPARRDHAFRSTWAPIGAKRRVSAPSERSDAWMISCYRSVRSFSPCSRSYHSSLGSTARATPARERCARRGRRWRRRGWGRTALRATSWWATGW